MIVGYGSITITSLVDIQSSCWYYTLSSSTPAKPTQDADPPSGWSKTEPSYTTGSNLNLYIVNKIVYGDGTFEYSDVSLSSSYEAAKQANSKIDTLEIGGRNLARGTGDTTGVHWVKTRATEDNGILTITPTTSAGYAKYIMDYVIYGDNVNQTFTLSFDAREIESASGYGTGAILTYMGVQAPSRVDSILQSAYDRYGRKDLTIKGEGWNRYSVSFTFPSDITSGQESAFTNDAIISFELGRSGSTCPLEVKNCKLERGVKATDWTPAPEDVDASVRTVNTELTNFITNTYASDKTDLQSQIDGKIETWYQASDPSTSWTTAELRSEHTGDIWYNTTNGTTWYYDGTQWVQQSVPDSVLDTIDDKAQIFISEPYPPYSKGDLWFNSVTSDIMTCTNPRASGSYTASDWEKRNKYTDDTAVNNLEIGGNNLYVVCNQVYGYLNTSGGISAPTAAKCKTSDYIPVSEGEHYVFQAWVPSIGASQQLWIGYVFYSDTSGTRVGGRTAKYATAGEKYLAYTDITVPANVMYIRVSYRQYEDGYCKLEKGNKPTDWSPAPEDVDSRITGTNLSPFFSYTPYVVGDYWTTWPTGNGYVFTPKGDGWVRIQKDNSTGSSVVRHDIYMTRAEMVRPGSDYTMLFEFRNNNSTGDSADSNVYIVQGTNTQFWGNSIKKILEGVNSNTASTSLISDFPPGTSGVYRKRFVKTSEPSDSSHWTGSEAVYLTGLTFRCAANSTIDYEVRISLYEGECISPYKPYNVEVCDFATVKTTANNALTTANGKNKVIYSTTQPSGVFVSGDTWFNTSTSGANAGAISKYNGTQWVAQQLGESALLAESVTASKIAASETLVNKLFAYDITAANCITAPILISSNYNGTIDRTQTRPTYDNNNTAGSIFNLYEGKVNIGGKLKYDSTNGLVLDGKMTGTEISIKAEPVSADIIRMGVESTLRNGFQVYWQSYPSAFEKDIGSQILLDEDIISLSVHNYGYEDYASSIDLYPQYIRVDSDVSYSRTFSFNDLNNIPEINLSSIATDASVTVLEKMGWCIIFGFITLSSSVNDWTPIIKNTSEEVYIQGETSIVIPPLQGGTGIATTSSRWASTYERGARFRLIKDSGDTSLHVRYGSANEYRFNFSYPCDTYISPSNER